MRAPCGLPARLLPASIAVVLAWTAPLLASESVKQITITAAIGPASALRVSSPTLVFEVPRDGALATASLEYAAFARTKSDGEVLLSVDPLVVLEGPGGAADVETSLTLNGPGNPTPVTGAPVTAARWIGSGSRQGRLTFTLRAAASGTYVVPVRLLIVTP